MNARRAEKTAPSPPNVLRLTLSRNLRLFRRDKKLTQREIAELAKVTQRTISDIESAAKNVTLDTVTVLAAALGVPALDMLTPIGVTGKSDHH